MLALVPVVVVGAGIWKDSGCSNDTSIRSEDVCDASIEHDTSLITYILSIGEYEIQRASGEEEFVEVYVPKDSLPPVMPYVINDKKNGTLYENLLNTTMFLEDWSILSAQGNTSQGQFAMPAYAAAKQCYKDYQYVAKSSPVPANAMVIFHDEDNVEKLSHVYSVTDEPDRFVFTMLPVTDEAPVTLPEGQCHPYQNLSTPHFHHASTCLEYDANWVVGDNKAKGSGLTAFIKLGPLVDIGAGAVVGGLIAGEESDGVTDAGSDAGYDGDDIVSNASSDMDMSDTDTVFSDDGRGKGVGAGTVATGVVVGVGGTEAAILAGIPTPGPSPSP